MKVNGHIDLDRGCQIRNCHIEEVPTLPTWTTFDEGRILYNQDDRTIYYGSNIGWVGFMKGVYIFTQSTPSTTWTINHFLNTDDVLVEVYDTGTEVIYPDSITHPSVNQTVITFTEAIAGKAIINVYGLSGMLLGYPWRFVKTKEELVQVLDVEFPTGDVCVFLYPGYYIFDGDEGIDLTGKQNLILQGFGECYIVSSNASPNYPFIKTTPVTVYNSTAPPISSYPDYGNPVTNGSAGMYIELADYTGLQSGMDVFLSNLGDVLTVAKVSAHITDGYGYAVVFSEPLWGMERAGTITDFIGVLMSPVRNIKFQDIIFANSGPDFINLELFGLENFSTVNCKFLDFGGMCILQGNTLCLQKSDISNVTPQIIANDLTLQCCNLLLSAFGSMTLHNSVLDNCYSEIAQLRMTGESINASHSKFYPTANFRIMNAKDVGIADSHLGLLSVYTSTYLVVRGGIVLTGADFYEIQYATISNSAIFLTTMLGDWDFMNSVICNNTFRHDYNNYNIWSLTDTIFSNNLFIETLTPPAPSSNYIELRCTGKTIVSQNSFKEGNFYLVFNYDAENNLPLVTQNLTYDVKADDSFSWLDIRLFPGDELKDKLLNAVDFVQTVNAVSPHGYTLFCPAGDYNFATGEGVDLRGLSNITLHGEEGTNFIFSDGIPVEGGSYNAGILAGRKDSSAFSWWYEGTWDKTVTGIAAVAGDWIINLPLGESSDFTAGCAVQFTTSMGDWFIGFVKRAYIAWPTNFYIELYTPCPENAQGLIYDTVNLYKNPDLVQNVTLKYLNLQGDESLTTALISANVVFGMEMESIKMDSATDYGLLAEFCMGLTMDGIESYNIGWSHIGVVGFEQCQISKVFSSNAGGGWDINAGTNLTISEAVSQNDGLYSTFYHVVKGGAQLANLGSLDMNGVQNFTLSRCKIMDLDLLGTGIISKEVFVDNNEISGNAFLDTPTTIHLSNNRVAGSLTLVSQDLPIKTESVFFSGNEIRGLVSINTPAPGVELITECSLIGNKVGWLKISNVNRIDVHDNVVLSLDLGIKNKGIDISGCSYISVLNNICFTGSIWNLMISGDTVNPAIVRGNNFEMLNVVDCPNSRITGNSFLGEISIQSGCDSSHIVGNSIGDSGSFSIASSYCVVKDNVMLSATIDDTGTDNTFDGNIS